MDLHNRVALVTGGSRGIGRAIAFVLADAGGAVAVNYRERAQEAAAVVEAIHAAGRLATAIGADVSVRQSVTEMTARIKTSSARSMCSSITPALQPSAGSMT
jgi:3-oxoacyl-[acyl-carrier protein] reductase